MGVTATPGVAVVVGTGVAVTVRVGLLVRVAAIVVGVAGWGVAVTTAVAVRLGGMVAVGIGVGVTVRATVALGDGAGPRSAQVARLAPVTSSNADARPRHSSAVPACGSSPVPIRQLVSATVSRARHSIRSFRVSIDESDDSIEDSESPAAHRSASVA